MIIVIGATSFIGVHTVTELVNQGCEILVHQANKFMLSTIRKVCILPKDKFYVDLENIGIRYDLIERHDSRKTGGC